MDTKSIKYVETKIGILEVFFNVYTGCYEPLDARIYINGRRPSWGIEDSRLKDHRIDISNAKVSSSAVKIKRYVAVHTNVTTAIIDYPIRSRSVYIEKDDLVIDLSNSMGIITDLVGYDGTHYCQYCEEFSSINPLDGSTCPGCHHSKWAKWIDRPAYKIGDKIAVE